MWPDLCIRRKASGHAVRVEGTIRQRRIDSRLEALDQAVEYFTSQLRPFDHQLVRIYAEIGEIVSEKFQADAVVLVEIALAEFDEATEWTQQSKVPVYRLASQGIENDVNTFAAGRLHYLLGKQQRARVEYLAFRDVEHPHHLALLGRTDRHEDFGADVAGHLDRRKADATGRAMDQDALALAQSCQVVECILHRKESRRDCCRFLKAFALRFFAAALAGVTTWLSKQ